MKLPGGCPTPLKNDGAKVSWDEKIPNWMEIRKKCSKPPTSIWLEEETSINHILGYCLGECWRI